MLDVDDVCYQISQEGTRVDLLRLRQLLGLDSSLYILKYVKQKLSIGFNSSTGRRNGSLSQAELLQRRFQFQ